MAILTVGYYLVIVSVIEYRIRTKEVLWYCYCLNPMIFGGLVSLFYEGYIKACLNRVKVMFAFVVNPNLKILSFLIIISSISLILLTFTFLFYTLLIFLIIFFYCTSIITMQCFSF